MNVIPLFDGQEMNVEKTPTGTLAVEMDYVPLLKGEALRFEFNEDYSKARVFKVSPYTEGRA